MAAIAAPLAATHGITVEEYLATEYRPDRELVEGQLKEKPMVAPVHGIVQILLGNWFGLHSREWNVRCMAEARTRVTEKNVRLPDVAVTYIGPIPEKALTQPPLIAIEVLSKSDTFSDLQNRAADFALMGVQSIWLIDPETREAWIFAEGFWQKHAASRLSVPDSPVYLDLAWLWHELDWQSA